jgi:hypothetical protein
MYVTVCFKHQLTIDYRTGILQFPLNIPASVGTSTMTHSEELSSWTSTTIPNLTPNSTPLAFIVRIAAHGSPP